jgi:hypothetical protein
MYKKIFDAWLAVRKNIWRQLRKEKRKEATSIPQIDKEAKKKTPLDYKTVGVRQTASMKWVSENSAYPPPPSSIAPIDLCTYHCLNDEGGGDIFQK